MMEKQRVHLYTDSETKRRIELAAHRHSLSLTDYCMRAIRRQLVDDGITQSSAAQEEHTARVEDALLDEVRALHQEIRNHRHGAGIGVDEELNQLREERDHDLSGLR